MAKLTPKQQRFVEEYLVDMNATQAAIRAGYSPKGASVRGAELLANRKVAAAVKEAKAERSERVGVDQDYVLRRLMAEAEGGGADTTSAARIRALELLGKHLGMFVDRKEHLFAKPIDQWSEQEVRAVLEENDAGAAGDTLH